MNKTEKLVLIKETGVIAILRAQSSEQLLAAAEAIHAGGVRVIEVTILIRNKKNRLKASSFTPPTTSLAY